MYRALTHTWQAVVPATEVHPDDALEPGVLRKILSLLNRARA
jgi:hypothetical protein